VPVIAGLSSDEASGGAPADAPRDDEAREGASTGGPGTAPARPRSPFTEPGLTRPRDGRTASYPPGRSRVAGHAPASTVQLIEPPPKRRMALALAVLALLVSVGGAYAVINRPKGQVDAVAPTPTGPDTPLYTLLPPKTPNSAGPTSAAPSTSPTPAPKPSETIGYDDAVTRLRAAVQAGADKGQIRPDVATDLLNFVTPLADANAENIDAQLQALRNKIADRAGEGALSPGQATIIRARVTDLERAAGM
jgi:serine/threonine-protein kinase